MAWRVQSSVLVATSLAKREQRLALLDEIRGELRGPAAAHVFRRMRRPVRNEERFAGLERHRGPTFKLVFQEAFCDVDDLFAGMRVPGRRHPWTEFNEGLDDLASGNAQIVPQEVRTLDV